MRPVAALFAVLLLLAPCAAVAAEGPEPERSPLAVDPFPEIVQPLAQESDPLELIASYVWNRFRDLGDILTIKLGWGNHKSIGFQARALGPIQVGLGYFEGWVFAIDRGCLGTMKEAEAEFGVSILYPTFIGRKVRWQTADAERRNVFFGDVGDKDELVFDDLKLYDDANQNPMSSTVQVQLPVLPKVEVTIHWGELFDFPLSFFDINGFRVPPAFHKIDGPEGPDGERAPAPSIFWHGQEEFESYD